MALSNPNLNGTTPLRVQPQVGEWGPREVVTARTKLRQRALMPLLVTAVLCGLVALGTFMFLQLQTGPMSRPAEIIVSIGVWVLPILLVASLVLAVVVWIIGRPYRDDGVTRS
ncbi:MAG TPA: hypothetical protein IAA98_15820 [Candidatus Avipropionibacterium avicola]|uniref:Uncharacterized protein n=1 Tax=Candidatus Avipropionibacterium avicola TaxID=2840701 RepID=A0A9D1H0P8_9ACTN|nr:hypothetical protein [Candidatus Avipropionibacterium avicola]